MPSGVARDQRRQAERHAAQHQGDRSLRRIGEADEDVTRVLEPPAFLQEGNGDGGHPAKQEQRERQVEDGIAGQTEDPGVGCQHQRRHRANRDAEQLRPQPSGDADQQNAGDGRRDPCRRLRVWRQAHGGALQPVEQDRLVEERPPVVERREQVAGLEQLMRGLRVVRLVRVPEGRAAQPPEEHDIQEHGTAEDDDERSKRDGTLGKCRHGRGAEL